MYLTSIKQKLTSNVLLEKLVQVHFFIQKLKITWQRHSILGFKGLIQTLWRGKDPNVTDMAFPIHSATDLQSKADVGSYYELLTILQMHVWSCTHYIMGRNIQHITWKVLDYNKDHGVIRQNCIKRRDYIRGNTLIIIHQIRLVWGP
jgi:hypothetical protein